MMKKDACSTAYISLHGNTCYDQLSALLPQPHAHAEEVKDRGIYTRHVELIGGLIEIKRLVVNAVGLPRGPEEPQHTVRTGALPRG
jgi:hypothetical protein